MKIVEINLNGNGLTSGGKKVLEAAEKWLFDTQDGEVRLKTLLNMTAGQQGIAELSIGHRLRPPFVPKSFSVDMRIKCLALINIHYSLKSSLNFNIKHLSP